MMKPIEITERDAEIEALKNRINELELLLKHYEEQFRLSQKKRFGASSEKSEYDQLSMYIEELKTAVLETAEKAVDTQTVSEQTRTKRRREELWPKDLPVEEIVCELPAEERLCPDCGEEMLVIGHECRDELVVIPAKVEIRRYKACTYACNVCAEEADHTPIIKARTSNAVIKGSFASPEFVAYAAHQKFAMGVPLYRQEQEWKRQGVHLSRQTMANWLIYSAEHWLRPLIHELKRRLLLQRAIHADETTFQVLKEPGKTPQSLSYLWCYRTSGDSAEPIVLAEYKPDRKKENPSAFLKGFSGYLHTDGYDAYHKLPPEIVIVGCWAHVRRKWDEALNVVPKSDREGCSALLGKRYCDRLFAIDRELASLDSDERYAIRLERMKPLMDEFFSWAGSIEERPKSAMGKAISYMFSQRQYLQNVLLDGRLELSNNRAERTIKPFVISRKNFLFANTTSGADAAAILFSLIETAKETGVDPFGYLVYVFKSAPSTDMNNPENLQALLPSGYRKLYCP
jgi:transposase